jgi:hypothetical protein
LQSDVVLALMVDFDHQLSISMYSALAGVATLLAYETEGKRTGTEAVDL